jgi:hypothetical protein
MSFPVTMTTAFENAASLIAKEAVKNAITKLSERDGFDVEEALAFVLGTGVQIKKEILPRNALPWCGKVFDGDCLSLVYKEGLYTQCPQEAVEGDNGEGGKKWCKKCAKQVAENGTPKNGDVFQRSACALMSYKVGKRAVIPYGDYMKRHKISREEAEEAAAKYGMHIDPVQFECKKRGRPTTTLAHMITPTQDLPPAPEQEEETVEQPWPKPWPKPVEAAPVQAAEEEAEDETETKVTETKVPETKPKEETKTKVPETKPETKPKEEKPKETKTETKTKVEDKSTKKANLEEGELEEESVFDDNVEDSDEEDDEEEFTAEKIENLVIADLRRLAESRGISTKENGKSIPIKSLRQIVLRKLNLAV